MSAEQRSVHNVTTQRIINSSAKTDCSEKFKYTAIIKDKNLKVLIAKRIFQCNLRF